MRRRLMFLLGLLLLAGCGAQVAGAPTNSSPGTPGTPEAPLWLWPAPSDPLARMRAAGITPQPAMAVAFHIHAHLDVYRDGVPIVVPANIGLDDQDQLYSAVHTHADSGVLHIENTVPHDFTLGQFFALWNVPLAGATAYVDGARQPDPSSVVLRNLQEIAVVFGAPPATIPSAFPPALIPSAPSPSPS